MKNNNKRVFIFVPQMWNTVGHEYQYTISIAEAFSRRGYSVRIIERVDAVPTVAELEGYLPIFRNLAASEGRKPLPWEFLRQSLAFCRELRRVLQSLDFSKGDVIFAPTILHSEIWGWIWNIFISGNKLPKIILFLRFSLWLAHPSRFRILRFISSILI